MAMPKFSFTNVADSNDVEAVLKELMGLHRLIDGLPGEILKVLPDVSGLRRIERRLTEAINARCTCGGGSPDDGCQWCRLWHDVMTDGDR